MAALIDALVEQGDCVSRHLRLAATKPNPHTPRSQNGLEYHGKTRLARREPSFFRRPGEGESGGGQPGILELQPLLVLVGAQLGWVRAWSRKTEPLSKKLG